MLIYASKLRFFAGLFLVSSSLATFFNRLLSEELEQKIQALEEKMKQAKE